MKVVDVVVNVDVAVAGHSCDHDHGYGIASRRSGLAAHLSLLRPRMVAPNLALMRLSPSILVVTLWPVLNLGAVGCGGGDSSSLGLDRSKYLDELSLDEIRQCCLWKAGLAEPGQHQCSDGNTVSIQTTSECFKSAEQGAPAPHCLVSLAEDCFESAAGDPCKLLVTEACKSYEACLKRK